MVFQGYFAEKRGSDPFQAKTGAPGLKTIGSDPCVENCPAF